MSTICPTDYTTSFDEEAPKSIDNMLDMIGADCWRVDTIKNNITTIVYNTYGIDDDEKQQPVRDAMINDHSFLLKDNPDDIVVWMFGSGGYRCIATRTSADDIKPPVYEFSCFASEQYIRLTTNYISTHSEFDETPDGYLPQSEPYPLEGAFVHNVLPYINKNMWALITVKNGVRKVEFNGFDLHNTMKWCMNQCEPWYNKLEGTDDKKVLEKYVPEFIRYVEFLKNPNMLLDYDEFVLYTTPIPERTFIHTYVAKKLATIDDWTVSVALH